MSSGSSLWLCHAPLAELRHVVFTGKSSWEDHNYGEAGLAARRMGKPKKIRQAQDGDPGRSMLFIASKYKNKIKL